MKVNDIIYVIETINFHLQRGQYYVVVKCYADLLYKSMTYVELNSGDQYVVGDILWWVKENKAFLLES